MNKELAKAIIIKERVSVHMHGALELPYVYANLLHVQSCLCTFDPHEEGVILLSQEYMYKHSIQLLQKLNN